jgi:hypothetical protein
MVEGRGAVAVAVAAEEVVEVRGVVSEDLMGEDVRVEAVLGTGVVVVVGFAPAVAAAGAGACTGRGCDIGVS